MIHIEALAKTSDKTRFVVECDTYEDVAAFNEALTAANLNNVAFEVWR